MNPPITRTELCRRLARSGHELGDALDGSDRTATVRQRPDTIVTVGLNLDPTLKPAYRERYFGCLLESEQNPVPALLAHPDFAIPSALPIAADLENTANPFMAGPWRWLLRRLLRFREVLLWPAMREGQAVGPTFVPHRLLEQLPRLRERLQSPTPSALPIGAIVLDLTD